MDRAISFPGVAVVGDPVQAAAADRHRARHVLAREQLPLAGAIAVGHDDRALGESPARRVVRPVKVAHPATGERNGGRGGRVLAGRGQGGAERGIAGRGELHSDRARLARPQAGPGAGVAALSEPRLAGQRHRQRAAGRRARVGQRKGLGGRLPGRDFPEVVGGGREPQFRRCRRDGHHHLRPARVGDQDLRVGAVHQVGPADRTSLVPEVGRWRPESGVKGAGAVPVHGDVKRWL